MGLDVWMEVMSTTTKRAQNSSLEIGPVSPCPLLSTKRFYANLGADFQFFGVGNDGLGF